MVGSDPAEPELTMNLPGRSAAAAACRNGGYVNWTDSAGGTFKNEGTLAES